MSDRIDDTWLKKMKFTEKGMGMWSVLLPPYIDGTAIVELFLEPDDDQGYAWNVALCQGVPDDQHVADDHVCLTSIPPITSQLQLIPLLRVLGVKLDKQGNAV